MELVTPWGGTNSANEALGRKYGKSITSLCSHHTPRSLFPILRCLCFTYRYVSIMMVGKFSVRNPLMAHMRNTG